MLLLLAGRGQLLGAFCYGRWVFLIRKKKASFSSDNLFGLVLASQSSERLLLNGASGV